MTRSTDYWNGPGAAKTFTHPLDVSWLAGLPRESLIVDDGCGYGRTMAQVRAAGFDAVRGFDISSALVERGRTENPDLRFDVLTDPPRLPLATAGVDAVLLFAVLTCIPSDADQEALIAELHRVLRPGGLLYLSDIPLQQDARNLARYEAYARRHRTPPGVFETDDGAICRHFAEERLDRLLDGFERLRQRRVAVTTMNGNTTEILQVLAQR